MKRWQLLAIPQVLLFGGMAVMLIVHPNAFTSALHSTRALVVNALLLAGWLLLSLVVVPRRHQAAGLGRGAAERGRRSPRSSVLVVPTLRDKKVVEEFPTAAAPTSRPLTPGSSADVDDRARGRATGADLDGRAGRASATMRSGQASIYRATDGRAVVALEQIDIEPGRITV